MTGSGPNRWHLYPAASPFHVHPRNPNSSRASHMAARIAQRQGCKTAAVVTKLLPWEGLDALAYALVALKMLAGVDRLVTVPLGELLRRGVSEGDVLRAGDESVARAG